MCFNYSIPYCLMAYFTAVQLWPWKEFFIHLLNVLPAKWVSALSCQYFIFVTYTFCDNFKSIKMLPQPARLFCKYGYKPKWSLCFKQVVIPFVLVSCAFEAVQVTTQLSSKRYSKCYISALVKVSNLFCQEFRIVKYQSKFKKKKKWPICCIVAFLCYYGLGFLFSDFYKLRNSFPGDKWV